MDCNESDGRLLQMLRNTGIFLQDGRVSPQARRRINLNSLLKSRLEERSRFLPDNYTISELIYCLVHNITEPPKCLLCGSTIKYDRSLSLYHTYCSVKCSSNAPKVKEQRVQTNTTRYGYPNPQQNEAIQRKSMQTRVDKYGVSHLLQSTVFQDKRKSTLLERYGGVGTSKIPSIQQKMQNSNIQKYGTPIHQHKHWSDNVRNKMNDPEWLKEQHKVNQRSLFDISQELQISDGTLKRWMLKYNIDTTTFQQSAGEKQLATFIQEHNIELITKDRDLISPYELDIYLPQHKIAIEYCGLYWHSDTFKERTYHQQKFLACMEKGIHLLTIFEDEWTYNTEIVKRKILYRLKLLKQEVIYARKCVIAPITRTQKQKFLDSYHIQGNGGGSVSYGLLYEGNLVAVFTFIKRKDNVYELNRYATSCNVVGGMGKLLAYFERNHEWNKIITFADLRWHNGDLYEQTNFTFDGWVPPTYEYVINGRRLHRSLFMRRHLPKWLGEQFDPALTEFQNTDRAGILRIWNCGLKRYVKINSEV